jgi:Domain of unknown function (DUF4129)
LFLAGAVLLCVLLPPRVRAENGPMSLPAYEVELDRWAALIDHAYLHPSEIPQLRASLPAAWPVDANGTQFEVSTDWLNAGLQAMAEKAGEAPAIRRRLMSRLVALRAEAAGLAAAGPPEPSQAAQDRLASIFSQREFRQRGTSWFDYGWQWITERLERIAAWVLGRLHLRAAAGGAAGWIVVGLALLAFVGLLRWSLGRAQRLTTLELSPSGEQAAEPRDWLAEALEAGGRRDYRLAVHSAYWAAVARLEALKVFPRDRSRTPRETLRLLPGDDARLIPLARLTDAFERAWYGFRMVTEEDWRNTQARLEEIGCGVRSTPLTAGS